MAVILTDMKMPDNCRECSFVIGNGDYIYCPKVVDNDGRMRDVSRNFKEIHYACPLRSVDGLVELDTEDNPCGTNSFGDS